MDGKSTISMAIFNSYVSLPNSTSKNILSIIMNVNKHHNHETNPLSSNIIYKQYVSFHIYPRFIQGSLYRTAPPCGPKHHEGAMSMQLGCRKIMAWWIDGQQAKGFTRR